MTAGKHVILVKARKSRGTGKLATVVKARENKQPLPSAGKQATVVKARENKQTAAVGGSKKVEVIQLVWMRLGVEKFFITGRF